MTNAANPGPGAPPPPVSNAPPQAAQDVRYGGFWIRLVAYVIDAIVLSVATAVIGAVAGFNVFTADYSDHYNPTGNLASLVIGWLYFALMESSERGATLGKRALGLRVVTDRGQRLSFANATGRYFSKFVSAIILGIGFIMVAFTERNRGLHDMMAGTLVIEIA
jgi:uncharacterized RDD family membrane protein YckC